MTCTEFLNQLSDLLENKVTASLRVALEEHLRSCEHCTITMSTTRKTIEIYRNHEIYELPSGLRERLQAAILAKCKKGC
jgi:Putative zinc-finger